MFVPVHPKQCNVIDAMHRFGGDDLAQRIAGADFDVCSWIGHLAALPRSPGRSSPSRRHLTMAGACSTHEARHRTPAYAPT
jgi:hypothetical protein